MIREIYNYIGYNQREKGKIDFKMVVGAGLTALALTACVPVISEVSSRNPQNDTKAPPGFPVESITSSVETFSTGNPQYAKIPRTEMTDPVGSLEEVILPGSVDGIPNPPGMKNVIVSSQEAWKPVDESGQVRESDSAFK